MSKKQAASAPAPVATPPVEPTVTAPDRKPGRSQEVIEVTPKSGSEKSTTEKLFSDMIPQEPVKTEEPVLEKKVEAEEKTEKSPEPTEPEDVYLEDVLEKYKIPLDKLKSRIKVDDKEEILSIAELKKRVQLNEHLNRAAQDLGRQRREWREERRREDPEGRPTNLRQNPANAVPANSQPATSENEYVRALEQRVRAMEERSQALDPVIYDSNIDRVARELRAEGFDNFKDYIPKMETFISNVKDLALQEYYDTDIGAKALFYRLQAEELRSAQAQPKKEPTPEVKERPTPPIIKLDSGQQPSTFGTDNIDDVATKYADIHSRWKQETNPKIKSQLLREMLVLQGSLPK